MTEPGPHLALLLLGGYRSLVDTAVAGLAERGFEDVTPTLEFAMRAVDAGAGSAADLGRRLSITKQSAARTIEVLLDRGYLTREPDPTDRRRKRLAVTARGTKLMRIGEELFNQQRDALAERIGRDRLEQLEGDLARLIEDELIDPDNPGWVAATV